MDTVALIKTCLDELITRCDTGFALAIHIRYTRPSLLFITYSDTWSQVYSERGYVLTDPVVHWGLTNIGWIEWQSLKPHDSSGVISAAEEFGLVNGWTYSTGEAQSRSIGGMTSSRALLAEDRALLAGTMDRMHAALAGVDQFPAAEMDRLRRLI